MTAQDVILELSAYKIALRLGDNGVIWAQREGGGEIEARQADLIRANKQALVDFFLGKIDLEEFEWYWEYLIRKRRLVSKRKSVTLAHHMVISSPALWVETTLGSCKFYWQVVAKLRIPPTMTQEPHKLMAALLEDIRKLRYVLERKQPTTVSGPNWTKTSPDYVEWKAKARCPKWDSTEADRLRREYERQVLPDGDGAQDPGEIQNRQGPGLAGGHGPG
jgi:hypothetical protein